MSVTVNSLSGGKTSSYMAVHYPANHNVFSVVCLDDPKCAPKDRAIVEYANTKLSGFIGEFGEFIATAEDDRTLVVMMDLEQKLGVPITWVRGMSFDRLIDFGDWKGPKTRLPSWARRYCTSTMKLLPIFLWWWRNIGDRCDMRIGFRFDEFDRMERFFNNSDPTRFGIPVSCATHGQRKQKWQEFLWRSVRFPLIKDGVTKDSIDRYWGSKVIRANLFDEETRIVFPSISNCIGCFHKKEETLAAMADMHPEKFRWFIDQEQKGMGTWLDNKVTYQHIMDNRVEIGREVLFEAKENLATCDTGGCTD